MYAYPLLRGGSPAELDIRRLRAASFAGTRCTRSRPRGRLAGAALTVAPDQALESEMTAVLYSGVQSVGHLDSGGGVRGAEAV